MNREELKRRIQRVIENQLKRDGIDPSNHQAVFDHAKALYIGIEEAGLIQPGMSFAAFQQQIIQGSMFAKLRGFA